MPSENTNLETCVRQKLGSCISCPHPYEVARKPIGKNVNDSTLWLRMVVRYLANNVCPTGEIPEISHLTKKGKPTGSSF
jgi:hypothetical protein